MLSRKSDPTRLHRRDLLLLSKCGAAAEGGRCKSPPRILELGEVSINT